MLMHAFLPELYDLLGVYLALITVNCIILGRAEMFAGKNSVGRSVLDGVGMGIGFTLAMLAMAVIREVFGNGTFGGVEIPFLVDHKIEILVKAPGGMLVYGVLIALVYKLTHGKGPKKTDFSCAGCPSAGLCHTGSACGGKLNSAEEGGQGNV
jgi:electron transport complex protein RnfE